VIDDLTVSLQARSNPLIARRFVEIITVFGRGTSAYARDITPIYVEERVRTSILVIAVA
jgi:hypothetical protein